MTTKNIRIYLFLLLLGSLLSPGLWGGSNQHDRDVLWVELSVLARNVEAIHDDVVFLLGQGSIQRQNQRAAVARSKSELDGIAASLRQLTLTADAENLQRLFLRAVNSLSDFYDSILSDMSSERPTAPRELVEGLRQPLRDYADYLRAFNRLFPEYVGNYHPRVENLLIDTAPPWRRRYNRAIDALERGDAVTAIDLLQYLLEDDPESGGRLNAKLKLADLLLHEAIQPRLLMAPADARNQGLGLLQEIVESENYSTAILGAYIRWRAMHQLTRVADGAAAAADIPYLLYNQTRRRLMQVLLDRLQEDSADYVARNQLYGLGELPNISRLPRENTNTASIDFSVFYGAERSPTARTAAPPATERPPAAAAAPESRRAEVAGGDDVVVSLMEAEMKKWQRELDGWSDPSQQQEMAQVALDSALINRLHTAMQSVLVTPPPADADPYQFENGEAVLRRNRQLGRMVHNFIESREDNELGEHREYLFLLRELLVVSALHIPYALDNDASRAVFWNSIHDRLVDRVVQAYDQVMP